MLWYFEKMGIIVIFSLVLRQISIDTDFKVYLYHRMIKRYTRWTAIALFCKLLFEALCQHRLFAKYVCASTSLHKRRQKEGGEVCNFSFCSNENEKMNAHFVCRCRYFWSLVFIVQGDVFTCKCYWLEHKNVVILRNVGMLNLGKLILCLNLSFIF